MLKFRLMVHTHLSVFWWRWDQAPWGSRQMPGWFLANSSPKLTVWSELNLEISKKASNIRRKTHSHPGSYKGSTETEIPAPGKCPRPWRPKNACNGSDKPKSGRGGQATRTGSPWKRSLVPWHLKSRMIKSNSIQTIRRIRQNVKIFVA